MTIVLRLDRMMADRKISLGDLAGRVGIADGNLSKIKNGKVSGVRFKTLDAICRELASRATSSSASTTNRSALRGKPERRPSQRLGKTAATPPPRARAATSPVRGDACRPGAPRAPFGKASWHGEPSGASPRARTRHAASASTAAYCETDCATRAKPRRSRLGGAPCAPPSPWCSRIARPARWPETPAPRNRARPRRAVDVPIRQSLGMSGGLGP